MNTTDTRNVTRPMNDTKIPTITRKFGRTTCHVYVHFSETSKETLNDKVERLISNEIRFADMP